MHYGGGAGPSRYPANRVRRVLGRDGDRCVVVPIDDSLISGPVGGLSSIEQTLAAIVDGRPNAVLGFLGQLERFGSLLAQHEIGLIGNLSASTAGLHHERKVAVHSVHHAIRVGCDFVACHVNLTAPTESEMVAHLGYTIEAAAREGVPTLAIVYPRNIDGEGKTDNYESMKRDDPEAYLNLIARCVRLAGDLGAFAVKTQNPGSPSLLRRLCDVNKGIPILLAGGPLVPEDEALSVVDAVASSDAAGVSFGRNVFHRANPADFIGAVRSRLNGGADGQ